MFYDEDEFEEGLDEEMAPEEESFPVDNGTNQSLGQLKQKSGQGSLSDANKLRDTLSKNQAKNSSQSIANSKNSRDNARDGEEENGENLEDGGSVENKLENAAKTGASEAAKKAASTYLQAHGIPAGTANKIAEKVVDSEVGQKVLDEAVKKFKDAKKKLILQIIGMMFPFVIGILIVLIIASSIMASYAVIVDKVESAIIGVSTGIEKVVNFASGNGWQTEEEEFFDTLQKQFEFSLDYSENGIDVPLLNATIHYKNLTDVGVYENGVEMDSTAGIGENSEPSSLFDNLIDSQETKQFYYVANDKLGSLTTFKLGQRRLIGHMVDVEIVWRKYRLSDAIQVWLKFFKFYGSTSIEDSTILTIVKSLNPLYINQEFDKTFAYESTQYANGDSRYKYYIRNLEYELQEAKDLIDFSIAGKVNDETVEFGFWAPSVQLTYDEDKYFKYLVDVYIPGTFYSDGTGTTEDYERIAREIFEQRDNYHNIMDSSVESVQNLTDNEIMVNVKDCNGFTDEVVSLYDYIGGVLYAEGGLYNNEEYLKARAVAVKNYLYAQNSATANTMPRTLSISSCSKDQLYCNTEKGCNARKDGTLQSGAAKDGSYYLEPLNYSTYNSTLKRVIDETYEVFIVDENERIVKTDSCSDDSSCAGNINVMDKTSAITLANNGSNYKDILSNFYSGSFKNIELNKYSFPLDLINNTISSRFGYRGNPISNCCELHRGIDFPAAMGSNIYSYANGVVVYTETLNASYGNYVVIGHGQNINGNYEYYTLYAHQNTTPIVYVGNEVVAGQIIGYVGNTGMSTGAHLHFEMYNMQNGVKTNIDPYPYLENFGINYGYSDPAFSSMSACTSAGYSSCGW